MISPRLSRRQLIRTAVAAAAALPVVSPERAAASIGVTRDTIEAWADTIIPGASRFPGDPIILGAAKGPGAVAAGAWDMFTDSRVGLHPFLPAIAEAMDVAAASYFAQTGLVPADGTPTFLSLDFAGRTAVAEELLASTGPDQLLWYAMAGMVFLAFHTAGFEDTARAVRRGHPGLTYLRFPKPNADGVWRFPTFSYRRVLARKHPRTTRTGHPA